MGVDIGTVVALSMKNAQKYTAANYNGYTVTSDANNMYLDITFLKNTVPETARLTFPIPQDGVSVTNVQFVGDNIVISYSDGSTTSIVNAKQSLFGMTWKDEYNNALAYSPRDVVQYNGAMYYCKATTTPGANPSYAVYWDLMCAKGVDGSTTTYKGGWVNITNYAKDDVVTYSGSCYLCTVANTNIAPDTDSNKWSLLASKGDTGISGLMWKSTFNALTTYALNDCVSYNGSAYVAKGATTGNLPTNTAYWDLLVVQGAQGDQGAMGEKGITWRGGFDGGIAYVAGDAVVYNKTSYYCIQACSGITPPNVDYWDVLAGKGELSAIEDRFDWASGLTYFIGDIVTYTDNFRYICRLEHTASATFAEDAVRWVKIANFHDYKEWINYTPVITGSTSNPTLATNKTLIARYKVVGKSLHLAFTYFAASSTGASAGSGVYKISLPTGFNINTTVAPIMTTFSQTYGSYNGAEASTLGTGYLSHSGTCTPGYIVGSGANTVSVYATISTSQTAVNCCWGSATYPVTSGGCTVKFTAEIPIV